jgi:hypothetical protein
VIDWSVVFLGVIAISTLVMALIQVGAIVAALKAVREAQKMVATVQQDVRPLIAKVSAIADEAGRTAKLATLQAEKVDKLVTELTRRVDETAGIVQHAIVTPAREGMAIVAAIKASLGALRGFRDYRGRPAGSEDEDPLFIG